jgi:hypothetical protein
MAQKMPGFLFSGYRQEGLDTQELISETQYKELV